MWGIRVDEESLAKIADRRIVPGMPADAVIATGERSVLQYLVDPILPFLINAFRER